MALRRSRLTLIIIYVILFFALCAKPISSHRKDPAPSPAPSKDTPDAAPSSGPSAESPLSVSELFELSMPEFGVEKLLADENKDGTKMAITQLEDIKKRIETFKTFLPAKLKCNKTPPEGKICCEQCQENLDAAIDGVEVSMESINKQDFPKANVDISGIATDIQTCNDCFPNGQDKDVMPFNWWAKGAIEECLNSLKNAQTGVQKSSVDQNNDGTKMAITQVEVIKEKVGTFKEYLEFRKSCGRAPPEAKKCCDQCLKNVDAAVEGVKVSMESINKQDLAKANQDISGIATEMETCNNCFVETKTDNQAVKDNYSGVKGAIEECLNNLKNAENGVQKSSVDQNNDGTKMAITQVEVIKERIGTFKEYLEFRKRCGRAPPEAKKCCDQCLKNVDAAIEGVKVSMESINKQDLAKANQDISGIATEIETCNNCFVETKTDNQAVKDNYSGVKGAIEECLNNLNNAENGVQKSSVDQNNDGTKITITQVEVIQERIGTFKEYLEFRKSCGRAPPEAKKCCDQCLKNVDAAIEGVKVSMESINKQDLSKANQDISGIATEMETCNNCFVETKTDNQAVKDNYSGVKEAIEECLNNLKNAGVQKIGVLKSSVDKNNEDTKMTITQLENIKERLEAFKTFLPSKKNCNLTPPEAKICCDQCQENLDAGIDGVKVSMESINKQDLSKANADISSIATDIQTCNDCFVQTPKGEDKDINDFYSKMKEVIEECLQTLKKADNGVQKSSVDQNNDGTKMAITQVEVIKERVETYKKYLEAKNNCGRTPPEAKKCIEKCQKNVDAAVEGVEVSMESINKQELSKADEFISGVAKDIETCNNCFIETGTGEDQHLKDYYAGVKQAIEECLNNLKNAENGVQKVAVQKSSVDKNNDDTKMTITQLEKLKQMLEGFKTYLPSKKNCNLTPEEAKKCCDQCQENLDDGIDGVKVSMESIDKQDLAKANIDISSIATDIQTCNDCFVETPKGEDKDVNAFYVKIKEVTEECLQTLKNAETGVQKSSVDQNNDGTKMAITQVEVIKERVETYKKYLEAKNNCGRTPPEAKKCIEKCQKNVDAAVEGVEVSMESINKQELSKADEFISGVAKDMETCNNCFIETGTGEDQHLKDYYAGVKQAIEECLNNLRNAENGVQKIGVQKSSGDKNNDDTKMTITQLEDIKQKLEAFKAWLPNKKQCGLTPPEAKICCDQCQGNLDEAIDAVKVSMESINKPDLAKANVDISGIATDVQTCSDCFVGTPKGEDANVKTFYMEIKGLTEECLQNLKKAEIGVQKSSVDQNNDGTKMTITQLEGLEQRIEAFKTWLPSKKLCGLTPPEAKKCCDECQENLDDAIDGVRVGMESINKQDIPKANADISGIATDIQTCNDCFVKTSPKGEDKNVKDFYMWVQGVTKECLDNLKKA